MKIQLTVDANDYRQAGRTPAQIARQLRQDVQQALDPILRTVSQVIYTGDLHVDGDFLETRVRAANDEPVDWRAVYGGVADAIDDQLRDGWHGLYRALLKGVRLPANLDQDMVIDAVSEIYRDVASGWLTPDFVRARLNKIDKICTLYGCLELYDQIAALIADRTRGRIA